MTVSDYYKSIFGTKTYKISLDAGCTCPNRDGTIGTGGCIFCNGAGSGDFAVSGQNIKNQIESAKKIVQGKLNGKAKYIVYFQSFTNTYGDLEKLKEKWEAAISCTDIVGIAIGTRPDCLSEECIKILAQLANKTFVQLELGLQTSNDKTAAFINRGYTSEIYTDAVKRIHNANPKIHVVTHIIFGLPGESREQMLQTLQFAISAKTDGIKIANLYIVKNSALEKLYDAGEVKVLEKDAYSDLLKTALKLIPENVVIHRLTGDPPKKDLIAPNWVTDKKRVINGIKQILQDTENKK